MNAKKFIVMMLIALSGFSLRAQTVNEIFEPNTTITWLGLDMNRRHLHR